jgi:hypothetical protein
MLVAWGRALAIASAVGAGVMTLVALAGPTAHFLVPLVTMLFAVGLSVFLYKHRGVTHATYERAYELAQLAGFNQQGLERLRQEFGKSPEYSPVHGFPVEPVDPQAQQENESAATAVGQRAVYFVNGRRKEGNEEVCITVHAAGEEDARQQGEAMGVAVTKVEQGSVLESPV